MAPMSVTDPPEHPQPGPCADADARDEHADTTLIRWMLGLSPTQRLETLQRQVQALTELRDAAARR